LVIIFVISYPVHANDKTIVRINKDPSIKLIIDFTYLKEESTKLKAINNNLENQNISLSNQLNKWKENYDIKKLQSIEWEKSYNDCSKEITKLSITPIYKKPYVWFIIGILSGVYINK